MRVGIVGCGYGASVLLPGFRADSRVRVVAIAARDRARVEAAAQAGNIEHAYGDWREMLETANLEAIAVAVPPWAQKEIGCCALANGVHVFAEKPLAMNVQEATELAQAAAASSCANVVDFNFREIAAFSAARDLLQEGAIGPLRHIAVTWHVESYANRARLSNWKADQDAGGGSLFNFVSHSLNYLEEFAGPIQGLSARTARIPGDARPNDSFVSMAFEFANAAAGNLVMSAAAYRGSGHRIDLYGEDGTLVLENTTADYMRGFRLSLAKRPDAFSDVEVISPEQDIWEDGRVLPVSRLVRQFVDWAETGKRAASDFAAGLRVQKLIQAARDSHRTGQWIVCPPDVNL